MQDWNEGLYGTYCCPVCNHRDGAVLERTAARLRIDCSYCEAPLELSIRSVGALSFAVQIAEPPVPK
jgi:transcription elongation factor Elf1